MRKACIAGQMELSEYLASRCSMEFGGCRQCICKACLYWWSARCPHGDCWDDHRAKENPYDMAHPNNPPRTGWSNWKSDQAYWCRGGVFYPIYYCPHFVKYHGCQIKECLKCNVAVYQDGYIGCSIVDSVGCEVCYQEFVEGD